MIIASEQNPLIVAKAVNQNMQKYLNRHVMLGITGFISAGVIYS